MEWVASLGLPTVYALLGLPDAHWVVLQEAQGGLGSRPRSGERDTL